MILVTGATGMLGSHLALFLLKKGLSIKATYRDASNIENTKIFFESYNSNSLFEKIKWIEADILDISQLEIAFQDCTEVYHCAALVSFDPKDEEKLRKINIEGTANIVNFCIEKKIQKLCHISSIAALGHKKDFETYIDENSDWNPDYYHSDYAISKYGAEMEVWRGKQEGLQVVIVNPGVILSQPLAIKNWDEGSNKIFNLVRNGLSFYTNGKTGFVAVHDVVSVMFSLMQSNYFGERYCLVSENKSYHEITTIIANAMHIKPPKIKAKSWMTSMMIPIDWLVCLFTRKKRDFSRQIVKSLHEESLFDNSKIKAELGFNFIQIKNFIDGLNYK
jgi:dihydroflavonol-4-reductase